jgi:hypothetical protein
LKAAVATLWKFLRRRPGIAWLGLLLAAVLLAVLLIRHLTQPRIIVQAAAPDGTKLCLLQRINWGEDPFFTTTFAYQKRGTNWQTCYYHHEDSYWGHARIELDAGARVARIYRGKTLAITFAWETETYTMHRKNRTTQGGQWQMPMGWNPETAKK